MPATHRPDFDAFHKSKEYDRGSDATYRQCFMWPYVNQEDLLDPQTLLLLLNSRGRHLPPSFAGADVDAMHLGIVSHAIVPVFLNEHVMILNGVTDLSEYGKLMEWSEHPDAFDWMYTQKQFHPGEGLLVLEAQQKLLQFLCRCCIELLQDIPESDLLGISFPILPEPVLKSEGEVNGFESLGVMATEAPYRVPAQLDLAHVQSLLAARASAAEDHIWALREDPDYFVTKLLELKDHRQELLRDLYGGSHPILDRAQGRLLWTRVIGSMVSDAYLKLELFSELSNQAKNLAALQQRYAGEISPLKELPEEYKAALLRFHLYLHQVVKGPLGSLKFTAVASPPLRKFFARQPPPDAYTTKIITVSKPGIKMDKVEQRVTYLLRLLWEDGHDLFLTTLPVVIDELDRLQRSSPQARDLLSTYITGLIGDISLVSQCIRQLNLYHPWSRSWENELADRDEELQRDYGERSKPWGLMLNALHEQNISTGAVTLGDPTDGRFAYPVEKRRTKENVEKLRSAETSLDAFWASIDQVMKTKAGDLRGTVIRNILSQPRALQRTPEWLEPEKTTAKEPEKASTDLHNYHSFSSVYSELAGKARDIPQRKTKVKTRGKPQPPSVPVAESEVLLQPNSADPQPTFTVDARAYKVFRTIFFNPAITSTPGEIPWNDFLHAMTSVGFTAMKLYGSVWKFEPTGLDVERNILFHEPHPRGKIPFTMARHYGRRLSRAYGWFGGMFSS
ncbi:hypothetical protein N7507_008432 [Penicillium longicatenatum]|nr:hypothetical protein N7507_008432 [Penicillium longicatenatum]